MISIFKLFIQAERTGNWSMHLTSLRQMLPFYHAAGHTSYAKGIHIYLQDMLNLEENMDIFEYDKFLSQGC